MINFFKDTKNIVIIVLSLIIITLSIVLIYNYKKQHTSYLESITILGKEVELSPNIYVYDVHIDSAKIHKIGSGCENPFTYVVSKIYEKQYKETGQSGMQYFNAGETEAYFTLGFEKYDVEQGKVTRTDAIYRFNVYFNEPLEIDDFCQ